MFGKPTLEARLSSLVSAIAAAFNLNQDQSAAIAGGDLTHLEAAAAANTAAIADSAAQLAQANSRNETLTTELAAANTRAEGFQTELTAAQSALGDLQSAISGPLQLTPEQVTAVQGGGLAIVGTAIIQLAQRKAVELAANQGNVPPVVTDPTSSSSADDEVATAFQMAREEKDPMKRGALYQRASNLVKAKKSKARN